MKKRTSLSTIFVLIQMKALMAQPVIATTVNYGEKTLSYSTDLLLQDALVTFGTVTDEIEHDHDINE